MESHRKEKRRRAEEKQNEERATRRGRGGLQTAGKALLRGLRLARALLYRPVSRLRGETPFILHVPTLNN